MFLDGRVGKLNLYDDIADAMKEAAVREGVKIRWGAAWHIDDFRDWEGTAEEAMNAYIDLRRSQGRRPFIDGPHFELTWIKRRHSGCFKSKKFWRYSTNCSS